MNRCFTAPLTRRGAWACVALVLLAAHGLASAATYLPRELPKGSLRGELTLGNWPEAQLGKQGVRMAPGARIKAADNTLVMPNLIAGTKLKVNYTVDLYGLVHEVWVLRPDELAKLWPETPEQASKWTFDPVTRTWTK
ncbi:hypothetical protein EYS42_11640 [Aquabacterium lacunae]|uniref:Uncharacterized protein n=1 Tax=Aquabacterium lacunae TaxID=2528630 RepID=A0A4Q9GY40_9BURK|nr:hypothetical protein [Aquabacterium lacunae]TBO30336.1 hypothetical protein EYS42_11640 [Aquabacterium lacunae]